MRFKRSFQQILVVFVLAAILAGCSTPTPTATVPVMPTVDTQPTLNAVRTQAVQTLVADLTKNAPTATRVIPTATLAPTQTPAPTNTPLPPTAVPTATYIPWTATPIDTATPMENSCSITEVSPQSTDKLAKGADFDGKWVVKNTGSRTWETESVDIKYSSGTKLQKNTDGFDLAANVASNSSLTVIVDMTAPADAGTYSTTWLIVRGSQTICTLNLTINVGN